MTLQRFITTVVEWVPQSFKIALRGQRGLPNPVAKAIHSILNRLPAERYAVLPCAGRLEGFQMPESIGRFIAVSPTAPGSPKSFKPCNRKSPRE